ncbi:MULTISPECIES: hypothetical protein [Thermus]|uniref:hypothetical protein n=1 Tax=Thermus TaxID=270 RepID=UPI001F39655A|nr:MULTISPECIES: hypothetical protein [Thermus]
MRKAVLLASFGALLALLVACGGQTGGQTTPLDELIQNDNVLYDAGQSLLDEAVNAFADLMPQGFSPQAVSPRPLTMAKDGEDTVLIGGPWRPPFPYPLPPVDKPVFVVIKCPSKTRPWCYADLAYLRQAPQGGYELEWHGERGAASVRTPAQVEMRGNPDQSGASEHLVKLSISKQGSTWTIDIIIILRNDPSNPLRMHLVSALPPDTLTGRQIAYNAGKEGAILYERKIREVCCGRPKPFPPREETPWLLREDVSVAAIPYDNPKLWDSTPIEELVGENLGFLYLRKKPWGGTTTDCGPSNVWCPPEGDPFLNLRLVRNPAGGYAVQLTKLGDPNRVIATLPAQVLPNDGPVGIGIEDDIASPEEPTLKITWPKIKIIIVICKGDCNINVSG